MKVYLSAEYDSPNLRSWLEAVRENLIGQAMLENKVILVEIWEEEEGQKEISIDI